MIDIIGSFITAVLIMFGIAVTAFVVGILSHLDTKLVNFLMRKYSFSHGGAMVFSVISETLVLTILVYIFYA